MLWWCGGGVVVVRRRWGGWMGRNGEGIWSRTLSFILLRFHKKGTMFWKSCIDLHCIWNCLISTWFHSNRVLTDQVFRERTKHHEISNGFERIRMEHPAFKQIRNSLLLPVSGPRNCSFVIFWAKNYFFSISISSKNKKMSNNLPPPPKKIPLPK